MKRKEAKIKDIAVLLKAARALIRDRKNWTRWVLARSSEGVIVNVDSPAACKFCAMGALKRASINLKCNLRSEGAALSLLNGFAGFIYDGSIVALNDNSEIRPHAAVLYAYDLAILNAEGAI